MPETSPADELVNKAFEMARLSGKDDWQRMTVPVLKNRILILSAGKFSEAAFGVTSFREFLSKLTPGLITIDDSESPAAVVIAADKAAQRSIRAGSNYPHVRPDLWRAALDYSSGNRYAWDAEAAQAKVTSDEDPKFALPTVGADEFGTWRKEFASDHSGRLTGDAATRLARWATEGLPTTFLPARLRSFWNQELKQKVEMRLIAWFKENHLQPPADLLIADDPPAEEFDDLEQLRRFVIACVRVMTEDELTAMSIPPKAALRLLTRRSTHG